MGRAPPPPTLPPPSPTPASAPALATARGRRWPLLLPLWLALLAAAGRSLAAPAGDSVAGGGGGGAGNVGRLKAPQSCHTHGSLFAHGQQVPRSDPCELCLCLDGALFCWWQHCPPTAASAAAGPCRASAALAACANASALAGRDRSAPPLPPSSTPPPKAPTTSPATAVPDTTAVPCHVMGTEYAPGEVLPRATGTCLECVCGPHGRVTCAPRDCPPAGDADAARAPQASLDMFDVDTF